MQLADYLSAHHSLTELSLKGLFSKPGVRYFPELHPALSLLKELNPSGHFLDASFTAGAAAQLHLALVKEAHIIDLSQAALRAAKASFQAIPRVKLIAQSLWDAPAHIYDSAVLCPSTDKGTKRVQAELRGILAQLKVGAKAHILMHKDQGAKRYEKELKTLAGNYQVLKKERGWRLGSLVKEESFSTDAQLIYFEAGGLSLEAEPGVFAAGKLDPGTAFLLESYDLTSLTPKKVLDIGSGYGMLSLKAALEGAKVTAVDDDLLAVRSTYQNVKAYGLDVRCLHSDINSALKSEQFEIIIMNPPFHVGKQVNMALPSAFVAAAHKHLKRAGELVFVANKALAYEPLLSAFSYWETVAANKQFKVLRAIK